MSSFDDDSEDMEEDDEEGNKSKRLRPNVNFLSRYVGIMDRMNKRLIAEGRGLEGVLPGASGAADAALAALLPPMPSDPQLFEEWQAQGEARILQLASHYGFHVLLKAKDLSEMTTAGHTIVARPNIESRLGTTRGIHTVEVNTATINKKKRKTASPIIGKSGIAVSTSLPEGGGGAEHAAADRRKKVSSASGISVNLFKAAMGGLKK